jgi:sigma-B regulation protein RsbU (phosphoserine phosphatase)
MRLPTFDDLVTLPEGVALQRHLDARNYRAGRWLLPPAAILALVALVEALRNGPVVAALVHATTLGWLAGLVVLRRRPLFERAFRAGLLMAVALTVASLRLLALGSDSPGAFIPLLMVLVALRLRPGEHLAVYGLVLGAAVLPVETWLGSAAGGEGNAELPPLAVAAGIFLTLALLLSRGERRRFLEMHRRESGRTRERLRMREEIDTARRVQVSMLPQGAPELPWLDLVAASLPATEVGGDYYDYFLLSPKRVALAVGDVAGHGLASGLLLSGVRSCLYLLEDELATPARVLQRLDAMVRRTTDKRTYVTLLLALLERQEDGGVRLLVASAGHPPLLRLDPRGDLLEEVGPYAPPLGTALGPEYTAVERRLRRGETLVLYSDGLIEIRSRAGQEYGSTRLERAARRAAAASSAREARDEILGDFSLLKGDAEQTDDVTLVVARLR